MHWQGFFQDFSVRGGGGGGANQILKNNWGAAHLYVEVHSTFGLACILYYNSYKYKCLHLPDYSSCYCMLKEAFHR